MILNRARKRQAAEEAEARAAAGLTEPVREGEVSIQSEAPYSASERTSSSPPKLDTPQRVVDKVPEIEKRMELGSGSEVTTQHSGYAQTDLRSISDHKKYPQPLQELSSPQYPVYCTSCTALANCSPQPWYLETTGVDYVDTCETAERTFADRLRNMKQQLERI
jgi:hypothetical protein